MTSIEKLPSGKTNKSKESKSRRYCSVPHCNNYSSNTISLHLFPPDKILSKKWKIALKIDKPISKYMCVCSEHFTQEDFTIITPHSQIKRLKKGVIPSKKIPHGSHPNKITSGRTTQKWDTSEDFSTTTIEKVIRSNFHKINSEITATEPPQTSKDQPSDKAELESTEILPEFLQSTAKKPFELTEKKSLKTKEKSSSENKKYILVDVNKMLKDSKFDYKTPMKLTRITNVNDIERIKNSFKSTSPLSASTPKEVIAKEVVAKEAAGNLTNNDNAICISSDEDDNPGVSSKTPKKVLPRPSTVRKIKPKEIEAVFLNSKNRFEFLSEETENVSAAKAEKSQTEKSQTEESQKIPQVTISSNSTFVTCQSLPGTTGTTNNQLPNKTLKLLIPTEYLPKISNVNGPLIIKVPGYPPLITNSMSALTQLTGGINIMNSPNFIQQNSQPQIMKFKQTIPPKKVTPEVPEPKPAPNPSEKLLSDKRFCWVFVKNRKRDLDGFSYFDRCGFYKAEITRAGKCHKSIDKNIRQLQNELHTAIQNNLTLKMKRKRSALKSENAGEESALLCTNESDSDDVSFVSEKPGTTAIRPKRKLKRPMLKKMLKILTKRSDDESYDEADSDVKEVIITDSIKSKKVLTKKRMQSQKILVHKVKDEPEENDLYFTKKVVILKKNQQDQVIGKRVIKGKNLPPLRAPSRRFKKKRENLPPSVLHKIQNKPIEKQNKVDYLGMFNLKPCYVAVKRDDKVEVELKKFKAEENHKLTRMFLSKYIDTLEKFAIVADLPLIIINEGNINNFSYNRHCSSNNVVFIVKDKVFPSFMYKNQVFISAVQTGLVKIVDSQVLFRHLAGEKPTIQTQRNLGTTPDHSYCMNL